MDQSVGVTWLQALYALALDDILILCERGLDYRIVGDLGAATGGFESSNEVCLTLDHLVSTGRIVHHR